MAMSLSIILGGRFAHITSDEKLKVIVIQELL